ncbi:hypothetical protein [Anaerococcus cruorum]|uniref:Uncharacterized protein n=1 Tax=Anaerococcus cruorum TaxID=3115617 RepID=A0ABW9MW11_9FIRM
MKNKILALGLSFTFLFAISPKTYADNDIKIDKELTQTSENEEHSYIFNVTNISESQVTLSYAGENRDDAVEISTDDQYSNITLGKEFFEDNVSLKDEYQIKTDKNIHELNKDNIKKEDLSLIQKYEKPVNMDIDKLPENTETIEVEVGEVFANDPMYTSANVFETGNKDNVYSISFDDLRDEAPQVGDKYKIYWDGIVMESYPGQFGEIYRVEKLNQVLKNNIVTNEFEIVQIIEGEKLVLKDTKSGKSYEESIDILEDTNPKVGDRYLISYNEDEDGKIGKIEKIEKWMRKEVEEPAKEVTQVEKEDTDNEEESVEVEKNDKKETTKTEPVKKEENKDKENKTVNGIKNNPGTGVTPVAPLLGVMAVSAGWLKKKSK